MTRRPYIVSIEGNIGSGKTTLIHRLEDRYTSGKFPLSLAGKKCLFLKEPLDIWKSIRDRETGENILEKFYKDKPKYGTTFQIMAYITFYQRLVDAINAGDENTIIVCERSLESSRAIFAKMLYEMGVIDDVNYKVLEMYYDSVPLIPIDSIIYLDITTETSSERIQKRGRSGEDNISPEYLEKCREMHENWLGSIASKSLPVLPLIETLSEEDMIGMIDDFIRENY